MRDFKRVREICKCILRPAQAIAHDAAALASNQTLALI